MNILAIETSGAQSSIAVGNAENIFQQYLPEQRKQISYMLPVIDALLKEAGLTLAEIERAVLSNGPGSFTGLRVGMGILQGMCLTHNIPVLPISSLRALAFKTHKLANASKVIVARNAYMGEVYYAEYSIHDGLIHTDVADCLCKPEDMSYPQQDGIVIAGDAWQCYAAEIANMPDTLLEPLAMADASDLIELAKTSTESIVIDQLEIQYLRTKAAWQSNQY